MRIGPAQIKRAGRVGAFACLGVAILASAIHFHRPDRAPKPSVPAARPDDPLAAELARCRAITRSEDVDDACRAAWAEVRRRFFAPHDANEAQP